MPSDEVVGSGDGSDQGEKQEIVRSVKCRLGQSGALEKPTPGERASRAYGLEIERFACAERRAEFFFDWLTDANIQPPSQPGELPDWPGGHHFLRSSSHEIRKTYLPGATRPPGIMVGVAIHLALRCEPRRTESEPQRPFVLVQIDLDFDRVGWSCRDCNFDDCARRGFAAMTITARPQGEFRQVIERLERLENFGVQWTSQKRIFQTAVALQKVLQNIMRGGWEPSCLVDQVAW